MLDKWDPHRDLYEQMMAKTLWRNTEEKKEIAFRAGLKAGYTKTSETSEDEAVAENESLYTDGLFTGLGISNEAEYNQIMADSEERQKKAHDISRRSLKSLNFGIEYGMSAGNVKNKFAEYSMADIENALGLSKLLAEKEENKDEA